MGKNKGRREKDREKGRESERRRSRPSKPSQGKKMQEKTTLKRKT